MKKLLLPILVLMCIGCKKETDNPDDPNNGGNNNTTETITCRSVHSTTYNASGQMTAEGDWYYTGNRLDSMIYHYYTSGTQISRTVYEYLGNNERYARTPDVPNSGYSWQKYDDNYNVIEYKSYTNSGVLQSHQYTTYTCD